MNVSIQRERLHRLAKSLNCDGRRGLLLLGTVILLLTIQAGAAAAQAALRYDRGALAAGQWWRLLTGHVIHLGYEHAILDVAGLVLIWALFARDYSARAWLLIIGLSVIGIDAGLWLLSSTTDWYVGSSGVLHGALAAGICAHLRLGTGAVPGGEAGVRAEPGRVAPHRRRRGDRRCPSVWRGLRCPCCAAPAMAAQAGIIVDFWPPVGRLRRSAHVIRLRISRPGIPIRGHAR
jgi:hypothetical protein